MQLVLVWWVKANRRLPPRLQVHLSTHGSKLVIGRYKYHAINVTETTSARPQERAVGPTPRHLRHRVSGPGSCTRPGTPLSRMSEHRPWSRKDGSVDETAGFCRTMGGDGAVMGDLFWVLPIGPEVDKTLAVKVVSHRSKRGQWHSQGVVNSGVDGQGFHVEGIPLPLIDVTIEHDWPLERCEGVIWVPRGKRFCHGPRKDSRVQGGVSSQDGPVASLARLPELDRQPQLLIKVLQRWQVEPSPSSTQSLALPWHSADHQA